MTKITNKERFEMLLEVVNASDAEDKVGLIEFINKNIAAIDNKAEKAKKKAAEKRAMPDELTTKVYNVLTDEFRTIAEITDLVNADVAEEDKTTRNKVVARLAKLKEAEKAARAEVKTKEGKKVSAYRLEKESDFEE